MQESIVQITCSIKYGNRAVVSAMMLLEWWRVQQGHRLGEQALPGPAGVGAEAPGTPA